MAYNLLFISKFTKFREPFLSLCNCFHINTVTVKLNAENTAKPLLEIICIFIQCFNCICFNIKESAPQPFYKLSLFIIFDYLFQIKMFLKLLYITYLCTIRHNQTYHDIWHFIFTLIQLFIETRIVKKEERILFYTWFTIFRASFIKAFITNKTIFYY